jgi:hypothetical protein
MLGIGTPTLMPPQTELTETAGATIATVPGTAIGIAEAAMSMTATGGLTKGDSDL